MAHGLLSLHGFQGGPSGHKPAISTLTDLIETCRDGENGFRTAAEASLKDATPKGRGTAATGGSTSGALHREWMNIRSAVAGNDDAAIIAEAERGEDVAKSAYEKALASRTLPAGAH